MQVVPTKAPVSMLEADAIAVGLYADGQLTDALADVDQASQGGLRRLLDANELTGRHGETALLLTPSGFPARSVVVVGLGPRDQLNRGTALQAAGTAAKVLAAKPRSRVGFYLDPHWPPDLMEAAVCGAAVGCQGQDLYRCEKKLHPFDEVVWFGAADATLERGAQLAEGVNLTRRLVNEPASTLDPAAFATEAAEVARSGSLEIEIWDRKRLEAERCGALLAVARGSAREPRLVILVHRGGPPDQPPLALVGKGVTFDSGGLSIKPADFMTTMKCDMAGAATVLGTMRVIAQRKLPANVIGLVGLVENMISGDAYRVGDVLTARSGKTIEVLNTDAEGRLVLADVLNVAVERKASRIIDLATLTGACVVALGNDVAGLMTNDQAWCDQVAEAARRCGEPAWELPMFPEFREQIQSKVADIKNVGDGRWGGAITAAKFLEEFVEKTPWVHIDIAGPSFLEKPKPWLDAGGSGAFVRTLVDLVEEEIGDRR